MKPKKIYTLFFIVLTGLLLIYASDGVKQIKEINNLDFGIKSQETHPKGTFKPDLNFGKFPLYFITNRGQVQKEVKFYAKASRYTLWLTKQEMVFDSMKRSKIEGEKLKENPNHHQPSSITHYSRDVSRFIFLDANKNPQMVPVEESKLRVNYFRGNDRLKWRSNIPTYQAVLYKNLYKHIDLKVYGIEKQIEYDWIVRPDGNPSDISFAYQNVQGTRIDDEGNLFIKTDFGELMHKRPVGFQRIDPSEKIISVDVRFRRIKPNTFGFEVGEYDKSFDLIIDPIILVYSTYLGGNGWEEGSGIAVDSTGYVYVAGSSNSTDFPVLNQYQTDQLDGDVVVTKIDPTLSGPSSLVYSTYLGGGHYDHAYDIAVDSSGNAYVTGYTNSTDFPTLNQYQLDPGDGDSDAFVAKIDTTQSGISSLVYSTYLGGGSSDSGHGIAADNSGNAFITGRTFSSDFPLLNQYQADQGYTDVFVTQLDTTQSGASCLVYSTYLGGGLSDYGYGIAVDNSGYVYVVGYTGSTNFPVLNQYQTDQGAADAFVTKIDPTQSGASCLVYSTYLGGSGSDDGRGIAVDSYENAYVTGKTLSGGFPTFNQYMTDPGDSAYDAFVTKIDTTQSGSSCLVYSSYLGGGSSDNGLGIAADDSGNAYVCGETWSADFPILNQYQTYGENGDAFVAQLDTTQSGASSLVFSTYLGGGDDDRGLAAAADSSGNVYVTGWTASTDFPTLNPYQIDPGDTQYDVYLTKLILSQITVTSPNGSENWLIGSTQNVTWTSSGVSNIHVVLQKDGSNVALIAKNIDAGLGSYTWTVGDCLVGTVTSGTNHKIYIIEQETGISDTSDENFTISDPSITVTSPNGGEEWEPGISQNITWTSSGVSSILIVLKKGGSNVALIAKNVNAGTGSYAWTVGDCISGTVTPGTDHKIYLIEKETGTSDTSNENFTISEPYVTVTSPNGGENWLIGSTQNITWTSSGISAILVVLQKDGSNVALIAKNVSASSGSYTWTVGDCLKGTVISGTGYKIYLIERETGTSDTSDNSFILAK